MMKDFQCPAITPVSSVFYAITVVSFLLAILILVIPGTIFLAVSNYLQIIAALAGAVILLVRWHGSGRPQLLLLAGAGFALWGLSNIAWYVNTLMGLRNQVFPSLIDVGMILSFLLLAFALWNSIPGKKPSHSITLTILTICLLIPVGLILVSGFGLATLVTLIYFAVCGLLIASGISWLPEQRILVPGAILLALAFMIYPVREMYLVTNPLLPVIGTFVSAGFALIALGLMTGPAPAKIP